VGRLTASGGPWLPARYAPLASRIDLRAVHAGRRRPRRGLPEIDRDDLAAIGQVGHDESSPPRLPASGTVTARAKAVATAASMALPPARSTFRPTSAAW